MLKNLSPNGKNMKLKNKIFLFPFTLLVIFFASFIIILSPNSQKKTIIALPSPSPAELKTYTNSQYGFEFQYSYTLKNQGLRFFSSDDIELFDLEANSNFSTDAIKKDTANHKYLGQIKIGDKIVEKYTTPGFEFSPLDTYTFKLKNFYITLVNYEDVDNKYIFKIIESMKSINVAH